MAVFCGEADLYCGTEYTTKSYLLYIPKIREATIVPNPVFQNAKYTIGISISEIEVEVRSVIPYCGLLVCGQEIIM
ncbi:MAG TPA: hypothetical protein DC024_08740 [Clostridiales bacterium]|nr:hypothetical protein [Clostridiales bacterium]